MFRTIVVSVLSLTAALVAGLGLSQGQPKDGKGPKDIKKAPTIDQILEVDTFKDDLRIVHERNLKGDGPDLIAYFRARTLKQPDPKEIAALVRQLGDEDFPTREDAYVKLANLGAAALVGLKGGESDASLEIRKRVAELKMRIDTKAEPTLQVAAARVLARLKPEGTADALMTFLPFVNDTMVVDEICKTLGAVALKDGKVDPLLTKALGDTIAVKRAAAGEALIRAGVKEQIPNVKKLLKDGDISVRYRITLAMLTSQDKDILPVMIDLLAELDPGKLRPIEEALFRLAGEKAPSVSLGTDPASRKVCRDTWAKWRADNDQSIDMARLTAADPFLGYTLVVQMQQNRGIGNMGEIYEMDNKKNVRWKFGVNTYPVDAQIVPGNRVLIAEYNGVRVTERDTKGDIKWEFKCGGNPFQVQRLANGNTFIAMSGRLMEVDRNHKVVWSYQHNQNNLLRARKLTNGEVVFITNQGGFNGTYHRMDPKTQKINKSFNVASPQIPFGSMDVLPNGSVLVPHYGQNRVVEYDSKGVQVAVFPVNLPNSVVRLPNGNTLIASQNTRSITEFDRNRNAIATHQCDGMVFVARQR